MKPRASSGTTTVGFDTRLPSAITIRLESRSLIDMIGMSSSLQDKFEVGASLKEEVIQFRSLAQGQDNLKAF
jgi:hypothetical protein